MDNRADCNRKASDEIDRLVAEAKRKLMQPNFTGSVSLELHASHGKIMKVVEGETKHHSLSRP